MKKKILLILLALLLAVSLVAIGCPAPAPVPAPTPTPTPTPTPAPAPVEKPTFKIGAIHWTDPALAEFYEGSIAAEQLAVDEINEAGGILGGRMVELLTGYDEGYTAEVSIASVKKALHDGADILIGYQDSTTALPAQAYCREKGVILTHVGPGTYLITVGTYPGFLRSGHVFRPMDRGKARWQEEMGWKTVVHLAADSKYCIDALADYHYVWDRPDSPTTVLDEIWIPYGAHACKLEATKCASLDPDFVMLNIWGDDIVTSCLETWDELGWKKPWVMTGLCFLDQLVERLGTLVDGGWRTEWWQPDPNVPENVAWAQKMKERNPGVTVFSHSCAGYIGIWTMCLAVDAAGGIDDLEAYDRALKEVDWITPTGLPVRVLENREHYAPYWTNYERVNGEWVNPTPVWCLIDDYFPPEGAYSVPEGFDEVAEGIPADFLERWE